MGQFFHFIFKKKKKTHRESGIGWEGHFCSFFYSTFLFRIGVVGVPGIEVVLFPYLLLSIFFFFFFFFFFFSLFFLLQMVGGRLLGFCLFDFLGTERHEL